MVDFGAFKGDYTGTVVRDNTIYGGFATDDEDEDGQTKGVVCTDGSTYEAALVVLATGAWTGSTFSADLDCNTLCTATG